MKHAYTLILLSALAFSTAAGAVGGHGGDEFTDDDLRTYIEAEIDFTPEDEGSARWEAEGWIGGDYQRLWFSTEGERHDDHLEEASAQVLYGRYLSEFWDWTVGLRHDLEPVSQNYLALGLRGLAPYRFETVASLYVSEKGDVTAEAELEHAVLLTQRLIAEPFLNLEASAQDVPELGLASGLTEAGVGLRLRYEVKREIAPYLEVSHERLLGATADLAEAAGEETKESVVRAGLRVWY